MSIIKSYMVPHPPLIIPEVGKGEEEQIKKTTNSYEIVAKEIAELKIRYNSLERKYQNLLAQKD